MEWATYAHQAYTATHLQTHLAYGEADVEGSDTMFENH